MEQKIKFLTKQSFLRMAKKHKAKKHWSTAEIRWEYHQKVIAELKKRSFKTILEAGTMGAILCSNADTIDLDLPKQQWALDYDVTYEHDLTKFPYPIKDKQYDIFIALRVYHHFPADPKIYLAEMLRIAHNVILAFPEKVADRYIKTRNPVKIIKCYKSDTTILIY